MSKGPKISDISNLRFGRLVALRPNGRNANRSVMWECRCDCGKLYTTSNRTLKKGETQSCGCLREECIVEHNKANEYGKTHGLSHLRAYSTWLNMLARCADVNNKDYGGRGITVCKRWLRIQNFIADMGERPKGLEIDRLDNDGNYEPGNCKWVTRKVNNLNRRCKINITFRGRTCSISEWSSRTGIKSEVIRYRYKCNWSARRILSTT